MGHWGWVFSEVTSESERWARILVVVEPQHDQWGSIWGGWHCWASALFLKWLFSPAMALQQPRSDGCNFWKQPLVTVSLTKCCSGRSVGAAVFYMTDSLWGSPQAHVAEMLGRQGEESWAPWGVAVGGLDDILKNGRVVSCKNKMLSCLWMQLGCFLLLHVSYLFLSALLMILTV